MSLPLILGCLWVLAATIVAMLPMRHQMAPVVRWPVVFLWCWLRRRAARAG